jgi:hypothetical protein
MSIKISYLWYETSKQGILSRLSFYAKFWLKYLTKSFDGRIPDDRFLDEQKYDVDYYCKIDQPISLDKAFKLRDINILKNSGYTYELYNILYPFRKELRFNFIPGDVTTIPDFPTFVKSRPIEGRNDNSVLLPLDAQRHFRFVNDRNNFADKLDGVVWRGAAYQKHRLKFLESCCSLSFVNAGNTAVSKNKNSPFAKPKMSIKEQLNFKFIVSLEGNDVATNLKWIMSSNSVCIMPKPKFETWFKEGTLVPSIHYIEIKDDYSDLEDVYQKYSHRIEDCEEIIRNANKFTDRFRNKLNNLMLARMVASKYQDLLEE